MSVILNTNRRQDTLDCLKSLAENSYPAHTALVVDNASQDESVEAIRAAFPETSIVCLTENLGYAGNNNVGIRWAIDQGADWILVLNEDTILAPDCLARMVETGESDPHIGVIGPMIYHFDEPNVIQTAGGLLGPYWLAMLSGSNEPDEGQYHQRRVDWISGCAMLIRRAMIEQIGLLDERFFIYWEEVDWCLRASRAGWHLVHVPEARLWHKGVQRVYQPHPTVTYYTTRNRFLFLAKNRAPIKIWLVSIVTTLRTLASWTLRRKWRHMRPHRNAMLQGIWDFTRHRWGMRP